MFKAMYMDMRNIEGDYLVGFFDSEESLIEKLKNSNNKDYYYAGTEQYAGKKCFVVMSKVSPDKIRYYLVKVENGWV